MWSLGNYLFHFSKVFHISFLAFFDQFHLLVFNVVIDCRFSLNLLNLICLHGLTLRHDNYLLALGVWMNLSLIHRLERLMVFWHSFNWNPIILANHSKFNSFIIQSLLLQISNLSVEIILILAVDNAIHLLCLELIVWDHCWVEWILILKWHCFHLV